ncbi:sugar ABC transporter ATP-binding protein [Aestuariibius sp. 2305UL40-4]|uniref:sugar ABC transporter ATP-binding protein n=1 Tax=Aestuariibius violaceus TaxID=3234132 RepID=UPI00345E5792
MLMDPDQRSDPVRTATATPILSLNRVTKKFPGVTALSEVSLELFPGQVTALVGENGAGKSTVVKILTGIYQPDGGQIEIADTPIRFPTAQDASNAGITAIHQETVLFDELSVAENVFLGHAPRGRFGLIDTKAMVEKAREILEGIGANIDPRNKLKDLGIANKHLVAIARALSIDARVVIMDEPTAALSQKEIEELYELVEELKGQGKAILFISHKFDEIFRIADNYTVFRDGAFVGSGPIENVSEAELVKMMVGRDVSQIFPDRDHNVGDEILVVEGYEHPTEFADISFVLRRGEILGFYGLVGAGRSEFMQSLFGITRPSAGEVRIDGDRAVIRSPADAVDKGIVYVPEDRGKQGAITALPIFQNVTLPSLGRTSRNGFLQLAKEFELAREYTERLDLRAASLDTDVGNLSGGNQQKVVIAKWLATQPKVIILDEPTKGIDIGSKAAVHEFMAELAAQGLAVIMVSSEIPEVLGMSDRVIVMREGRIVAELSGDEMMPETLVRHAAGI